MQRKSGKYFVENRIILIFRCVIKLIFKNDGNISRWIPIIIYQISLAEF